MRLGWWTTGLLTVSGLKALIMPSVTLGLFQMTLIMRLVRAEMLEVLRTDYIKFARARGLTTRAIHFGHALKNTLVPVITIVGLQFGSVIAFAIITETVFQWPGMGLLFVQAVQNVDIPIMAAYLMLVALIFVVDQPRRRHPLHDRRSAPAIVHPAAGLRRGPWQKQSKRCPPPPNRRPGRGRFLDSDVWASFKRSKLTMVAAFRDRSCSSSAAVLAGLLSPQDPFDPAQLELMNSRLPPIWDAEGQMPFLLGTDEQGRDIFSAILYGLRISLARRLPRGRLLGDPRHRARPASPAMSAAASMRSSCASPTCS